MSWPTRGRVIAGVLCLVLAMSLTSATPVHASEVQYYADILALIQAARLHIGQVQEAILDCGSNFGTCAGDPTAVITRLNASRNGLIFLRSAAQNLSVPERYGVPHGLVLQSFSDMAEGLALMIEGLEKRFADRIELGSDLLTVGQQELDLASQLLEQDPPSSNVGLLLLAAAVIAVAVSVSVSLIVLYLYYRRVRGTPRKEE